MAGFTEYDNMMNEINTKKMNAQQYPEEGGMQSYMQTPEMYNQGMPHYVPKQPSQMPHYNPMQGPQMLHYNPMQGPQVPHYDPMERPQMPQHNPMQQPQMPHCGPIDAYNVPDGVMSGEQSQILQSTRHPSPAMQTSRHPVPAARPRKQSDKDQRKQMHQQSYEYNKLFEVKTRNQGGPSNTGPQMTAEQNIMHKHRQQLQYLICNNASQNERYQVVHAICQLNLPFSMKYEGLDISTILSDNQHCEEDILKIPTAFGVLEKYATNLLKPLEQRHHSWRTVQFSSAAFQTKIKFLNGCVDVLCRLGYKESIRDDHDECVGLSFETNKQPNVTLVLNLSIDLTIGKFEVEAILTGRHPRFEQLRSMHSVPDMYFQIGSRFRFATDNSQMVDEGNISFAFAKSSLISNDESQGPPLPLRTSRHRQDISKSIPNTAHQEYSNMIIPPSKKSLEGIFTFPEKPQLYQSQIKPELPSLYQQDEKHSVRPNISFDESRRTHSTGDLQNPKHASLEERAHSLSGVTPLTSDTRNHKFCASCGVKCQISAKFCESCGKQFVEIPQNQPEGIEILQQEKSAGEPQDPNRPIAVASGNEEEWSCQHCTFYNSYDTNVCGMCFKTSWIDKKERENIQKQEEKKKPNQVTLINDDQEDGKKAVNEEVSSKPTQSKVNRFKEFFRSDSKPKPELIMPSAYSPNQQADMQRSPYEQKQEPVEPPSPYEQKVLEDFILIDPKNQNQKATFEGRAMFETAPPNKLDLSAVKENYPDQCFTGAAQFSTAPVHLNNAGPYANNAGPYMNRRLSNPHSPLKEEHRLKRELEAKKREHEERMKDEQMRQVEIEQQKEMKANAEQLVALLKFAEQEGYTVEECYLAVKKLKMFDLQIFDAYMIKDWLENSMRGVVLEVVNLCSELLGQDQGIGKISFNESKALLVQCDGEKEKAVQCFIENRRRKVTSLMNTMKKGDILWFQEKDITNALFLSDGNEQKATNHLQNKMLDAFRQRIYLPTNTNTSQHFYKRLESKDVGEEVKLRMLIAEYDMPYGRAMNCIKLINESKYGVDDCIEAAKNNQALYRCRKFLQNECETCYDYFSVSKLVPMMHCQCRICYECFSNHISVVLKEKHIRHLVCPICSMPKLDGPLPANYFEHLTEIIKHLIRNGILDGQLLDTYETKLRDFSLVKEEKFRWCSKCGNGFLWEDGANQIRVTCDRCKSKACYLCKQEWEDQHEGITCQEFKAWKESNDPELQKAGVSALLAKNGIECPDCQFKYELALGGCIHFICTQCGFEFCNGCDQEFLHVCHVHPAKGIHAHHPRDCYYYLRDNSVDDLQKLLADNNVNFDTELPEEKKAIIDLKCDVEEQKEMDGGLLDGPCERDVEENMAGICTKHYIEYLVKLINRNGLDPIHIMLPNEIEALITREGKQMQIKQPNEGDAEYLQRIIEFATQQIPLPPRKEHQVAAAAIPLDLFMPVIDMEDDEDQEVVYNLLGSMDSALDSD